MQRNHLFFAQELRESTPNRKHASVKLDDIDKQIIRHLQEDGRMPYTKLGPMIGLSAPAARQRVLALIESGAMQVVAVTDPLRVGFAVQAMIGIRVNGDLDEAAKILSDMPEVDYLVLTTGRFDILCEVIGEDNDSLLALLNRIRTTGVVDAMETFTYLRLAKQTYDWGAR